MGFEEVAEIPDGYKYGEDRKNVRPMLVDFLNSGIKYAKTDINFRRVSQIKGMVKRYGYPIRILSRNKILYFERLDEGAK